MATANHVLLRRITVTNPVSSIVFDSIPQTGYTDLKFMVSSRVNSGGPNDVKIQFNTDTTTGNYFVKQIQSNGSSASSGNGEQQTATSTGSADTASTFATSEIYIPNYTSSVAKTHATDTVTENNGTTAYATLRTGRWSGTAAITTITFSHNGAVSWAAGSSFSLYGIADVNTIPLTAPKADGGDIIKTDGTYWYHAFLSTGSFKPQLNLTADILQIAGGGGAGGFGDLGAGGAGGLLGFTSQALTSGSSYVCTVGAGGAAGDNNWYSLGAQGGNSQFASLTASVGGGGGRSYNASDGPYAAGDGGSGGGGGSRYGAPGNPTSGQGYRGGYGSYYVGGGGGGAGGIGADGGGSGAGGAGGVGLSTYSSWGSATGTGHNVSGTYYYAGGGAAQGATGGNGGGGNTGVAGAAATGGGGGGSYGNGKAGGSGVIIIRYPVV